ncbi:MAG TPA: LptA/OstA family protein [Gemmatimonadales bacterium]
MTLLLYAVLALHQADPSPGGRACRIEIDSVGRLGKSVEVSPGPPKVYNYFAGGGVWARCQGTGSSLTADSVAWYGRDGRLDLVGNVRIRDELINLDATTARYHTRAERLEAHRNVVAVNRSTGTVLRGPNLTYLRAVEGMRDTTEMFASSRPTIEYKSDPDSAEPYVVVGDRVRMRGNDRMWAGGRVTVDRSDLAARADSMMMNESAGRVVLVGRPRLQSHEWTLSGDTIHLVLQDGTLHQTLAWGRTTRPRAFSAEQTVEGDSLALDTPGQVLTELRAFGKALSTSKRDTSAAADVDWIAGDTLVAHFAQVADTGSAAKSQLQEIVARGSARALTHMSEENSSGPPDINYSRGTSIAVKLKGDRIGRVVVSGRADGVHLERLPPAPATPTDTTRPPPRP